MAKIGFITLGCKVNIYESNALKDEFERMGYETGEATSDCDAFVINTCSVTNMADAKSRKMIHKCVHLNPNAIVCVMGCYSQSNEEAKTLEGVDILLGNSNKHDAIQLIDKELKEKKKTRYVNVIDILKERKYEELEATMFDHTRAFVKIEDGCQNFCTYCVIPYARGPVRSKSLYLVLREMKNIADMGYKEIVLSGIDTGKYYDKDTKTNFSGLIRTIIETIPAIKRIRVSSVEVTQIDDEFIKLLKESKVIADHIHLPLQAGSDNTLKAMNRKYNLDYYTKKVELMRSVRPNISITSDIIVGFPTETDQDFIDSMNYIENLGMAKLHVFPFSQRNNTPAAKMKDIAPNIKKDRTSKMIKLSYQLERKYNEKFIGSVQEVLFEETKNGYTIGHSSNFLEVKVKANENLEKKLVNVKIISIEEDNSLDGEVLDIIE